MNHNKSHRKLKYHKVSDIWRDGQVYEAQGMNTDEISQLVGIGVGNWSRFKRLVNTSQGELPFGSNLENRFLAKDLLKRIDTGELSYTRAFRIFQEHLKDTNQPVYTKTPGTRKQPSEEKLLELYHRAVLTMEGSMYALSKLPEWPENWSNASMDEYIERLAKARKVLEQKINSLRRATNNAQAQSQVDPTE